MMSPVTNGGRVTATVAKWSETVALILGVIAVCGMLAVGLTRTYESQAQMRAASAADLVHGRGFPNFKP